MRIAAIGCALLLGLGATRGTAGQTSDRWLPLFDGRSLHGWFQEQGARWRVDEGSIVADAGDDGWLRSATQYADFSLRIRYKNAPNGNSGVFLRATKESNTADPSNPRGSYELQINNEDDKWATGSIENFIQRLTTVNPAPNQRHAYEVEVRGDHLVATLDGVKVLDGRDATLKRGYIGLQHHKNNRIEFRDISIRLLTRSER